MKMEAVVSGLNLYNSEKYKVTTGAGNLALCTAWTLPEVLIAKNELLKKKCGIISTLYSKEGVSIILRNLALNPQITKLLVYSHGKLSLSKFGSMGTNLLRELWEKGVDSEGFVVGTNSKVHKEIDTAVIEKIRKNVELIDVSNVDFGAVGPSYFKGLSSANLVGDEAAVEAYDNALGPSCASSGVYYMEAVGFLEPVRDSNLAFPSEEIGFNVRGKTVCSTWLKVVDKIVRYGKVVPTAYGNSEKQVQTIQWVVENEDLDSIHIPDWPSSLRSAIGLDLESIEKYKNTFLDGSVSEDVAYTYGQRLRAAGNVDQVNMMIDKLVSEKHSRRVVASLYLPEDLASNSPPCLNHVQCMLGSDGNLNMTALFRSHDIFKAAIPNAFGLLNLLKYIVEQVNLKMLESGVVCGKKFTVGKLCIISNDAHIYEEEWKDALDIVKCQLWSRPNLCFDENDADKRGIVKITKYSGKISAELMSANGESLLERNGKTAKEIIMVFSSLDLLGQNGHYVDIAMELVKAELAMKMGLEYVQDRALVFGIGGKKVVVR